MESNTGNTPSQGESNENANDNMTYPMKIPKINIVRASIEGALACETDRKCNGDLPATLNEDPGQPNQTVDESNHGTEGHGELNEGHPSDGRGEKKNERASVLNAIQKLREQRMAREKARLEKIRQMNLLKYKSDDDKTGQNISKTNPKNNIRKSCAGHMIPKLSAGHSKPYPEKTIPKSVSAHVFPKPAVPLSKSTDQVSKPTIPVSKPNVGQHSKSVVENGNYKQNITPGVSRVDTANSFVKPNVLSKVRMSTIPTNKPLPITKRVSVVPPVSKDKIDPVICPKMDNSKSNMVALKKDIAEKSKILPPKEDVAKKVVCALAEKKTTLHRSVPSNSGVQRTISGSQIINNNSKVPTAHVKPMPSNDQIQRSKVPPQNRSTLSSIHRRSTVPKFVPKEKEIDTALAKKNTESQSDSHITDVRQALMNQLRGIQKESAQKISVFDRLSKPKHVTSKVTNTPHDKRSSQFVEKTPNKHRHSMMPAKSQPLTQAMTRRSISSVHFKRLAPNQRKSCIHRSLSVSDSLNRKRIDEINEDDEGKDDVVYAVKSERKKTVKFTVPHTPGYSMNTPRPADLRMKLANWLHTKGRSVNTYQHLQCFGITNLMTKPKFIPMADLKPSDDENKENVEISDDASYTDNIDDRREDFDDSLVLNESKDRQIEYSHIGLDDGTGIWDKWRRASHHLSDTLSTSIDSHQVLENSQIESLPEDNEVGEIIHGALTELLKLIRESYEWDECARWLRAIRERHPASTESALYWECRAALEEQRGNFPRTMECWERAIIQGVKPSTVEASLDQLLDKFMKLQLSPNSAGTSSMANPKLLDVKNVFKSTLIRFAVQQKRIRESQTKHEVTKVTATPVRRSSRLDTISPTLVKHRDEIKLEIPRITVDNQETEESNKTPENEKPLPKLTPFRQSATRSCRRTPLVQICSSLQQIDEDVRRTLVFVPNKALEFNDSP